MSIIKIVLGLALLIAGLQIAKIYFATRKVDYSVQPWQQLKPEAGFKVLFAGDSTAVGTGLTDTSYSTAGLFGKDFPEAYVENHSRNGLKLKGLIDILNALQDRHFDLAVLHIGANDILGFTPIGQIRREQARVLELTKHIASKIVILHSGDIGEAPMLIWPFTWIYTWRSLKVRDIYLASQDERVAYVDIYTRNKTQDLSNVYAKDSLHLNEQGYALWYSYIKDVYTHVYGINPGNRKNF